MKVGLVGFGSIGFDVGKRIDQGIENFELAGISSRTKENVSYTFNGLNYTTRTAFKPYGNTLKLRVNHSIQQ